TTEIYTPRVTLFPSPTLFRSRGALPMLRIGNGSGSLRSPPGSRCAARSGSSQAAVDRLASLL
ncbi:hypothetical protein AB0K22_32800, partial [Rhodococcus baikonurensis]|uniref:hypothetical protein n=1 Tax=Rhodococcus baikonurensis TaxID=172041 RepID=UPI00342F0A5F